MEFPQDIQQIIEKLNEEWFENRQDVELGG